MYLFYESNLRKMKKVGLIVWGTEMGKYDFFYSDNLDDLKDKAIRHSRRDIRGKRIEISSTKIRFYSFEFTLLYKVCTIYYTLYDEKGRNGYLALSIYMPLDETFKEGVYSILQTLLKIYQDNYINSNLKIKNIKEDTTLFFKAIPDTIPIEQKFKRPTSFLNENNGYIYFDDEEEVHHFFEKPAYLTKYYEQNKLKTIFFLPKKNGVSPSDSLQELTIAVPINRDFTIAVLNENQRPLSKVVVEMVLRNGATETHKTKSWGRCQIPLKKLDDTQSIKFSRKGYIQQTYSLAAVQQNLEETLLEVVLEKKPPIIPPFIKRLLMIGVSSILLLVILFWGMPAFKDSQAKKELLTELNTISELKDSITNNVTLNKIDSMSQNQLFNRIQKQLDSLKEDCKSKFEKIKNDLVVYEKATLSQIKNLEHPYKEKDEILKAIEKEKKITRTEIAKVVEELNPKLDDIHTQNGYLQEIREIEDKDDKKSAWVLTDITSIEHLEKKIPKAHTLVERMRLKERLIKLNEQSKSKYNISIRVAAKREIQSIYDDKKHYFTEQQQEDIAKSLGRVKE